MICLISGIELNTKHVKWTEILSIVNALTSIDSELLIVSLSVTNEAFNALKQINNNVNVKIISLIPNLLKVTTSLGLSALGFNQRFLLQRYLDIFASRIIGKIHNRCKLLVVFPPSLPRTLIAGKECGITTVTFGTTAFPSYNLSLLRTLNEWREYRKTLKFWTAVEQTYLNADYILAYSKFAYETYINNGIPKDRIYITEPGVDIRRFNPNGERNYNKFRILSVGNYNKLKGFQFTLKAWDSLAATLSPREFSEIELVFVGNPRGSMIDLVNKYSKKYDNFKPIPFTKHIETFYRSASVLVHPSLTEGAEKVTPEAMATGLPVIKTPSGFNIVHKKEGLLTLPDPESIARKILWMYENQDKREKMGRFAREKIIKNYQWIHFKERIIKALEKIYKRGGYREKIQIQYKTNNSG